MEKSPFALGTPDVCPAFQSGFSPLGPPHPSAALKFDNIRKPPLNQKQTRFLLFFPFRPGLHALAGRWKKAALGCGGPRGEISRPFDRLRTNGSCHGHPVYD
jgi:hypothetical protein